MMRHSPPKTSQHHSSEPNLALSSDINDDHISQRKRKRGVDADFQRIENMVQEMKTMFSQLVANQTEQNGKIDSLRSTLDNIQSQNKLISTQNLEIRSQNEEIRNSVQFLSDKYDEAIQEINHLKSECTNNNKTIKNLELKIDFLEKSHKSSSLEITNIPASNPENRATLAKQVQKLGEIINQPVPDTNIKNIFRTKGKKDSDSIVILEFTTPSTRDQFLKSTRLYNKRNNTNRLNTTHLHSSGPKKPIYISEALTTMTKRLHYLTREFIKSSSYEQCWTANGKVYVREKEGMPRRLIKTEEDIEKLRREK